MKSSGVIMAQILDPVPADRLNRILCCYVNATSKIQIARISNIPNWYFERVVFPGQRLIFEALPEALLEIHTGMMASAILSDTIPCYRLGISTDSSDQDETASERMPETRYNPDKLPTINRNKGLTETLMAPALTSVD